MIRFLFILTLLILLLTIGKNYPVISFTIYLSIIVSFLIIMNMKITKEDIEDRKNMISTNKGRYFYNLAINSSN